MIDVSDRVPAKPVTAELLESRGSHVRKGDLVVLRSNLHQRFPSTTPDYWQQSTWLDAGGSKWIVERGAKALAIDFPQDYNARDMNDPAGDQRRVRRAPDRAGREAHAPRARGQPLEDRPGARVSGIGWPLRLPKADGGPAGPVALTRWPSPDPRIVDLSLPVRAGWRGRVSVGLAKTFEAGDPVQETGVRFEGHSHTHVLTPRYVDPAGPALEGFLGAPLVGPADIVDLSDTPADTPIESGALERRLPDERGGDILILRTGFAEAGRL